ncbi:hypothetical protein [Chitinophaga sp.]|uniref:hypothetical protein n=1 Tax=Chitinophaga sp. TaxID=1869181 RepID=UPI002638E7C2|nr:hypothetical protein [uncultured Chitinophaga sp.]
MQNEQQEIHGTTVPVNREEAERGSVDPQNIPGDTVREEDGSPVVDEQDLLDNDLREEEVESEDQDPDTEGQP